MEAPKHVFECKAGKIHDLVIAETKDAAIAKFARLTTVQGKTITINEVKAEFLYTVRN
jgi:hypothetical protein